MDTVEYAVVEVDDLPGSTKWFILDEPDIVTLVVKRGHWSARVAADGWAAYRAIVRQRAVPVAPPNRWLHAAV